MTFKVATDYWFTEDKWEHLGGCTAITCVLYTLISLLLTRLTFIQSIAWAAGATVVIGFAYEIKDGLVNDGFSYKDFIADIIGVVVAVVAVML